MLAGLLFAIAEAQDRPGKLTATLPFGGLTLLEYQARGLIAAGASQLIVVVARMTPELLGALTRIGRRGVAVDAVRNAAEAATKLHPLARALMMADGLVTTSEAVATLAGGRGDALLVLPEIEATGEWERVGAQMAWAGLARLEPRRLAELATLPSDYDLQSGLLRVIDQAGAVHVRLPQAALRHGHGVEHRAVALAARGRLVMASLVSGRRGWFDRWILGPIARATLPPLVERGASGLAVSGVGAGAAALGIGLIGFGAARWGTAIAFTGTMLISIGAHLSGLRDEMGIERAQRAAALAVPALIALALGWLVWRTEDSATALAIAIAAIAAAAIGERAVRETQRRLWWGTPPAYLLVAMLGVVGGEISAGLALAAFYAGATLSAGVEALRRQA